MPMRDTLHRLVDDLPESALTTAERLLNYLRATADPVLKALLEAPLADEPETEEERRAVQEGHEELAQGQVRTPSALPGTTGRAEGSRREVICSAISQRQPASPAWP